MSVASWMMPLPRLKPTMKSSRSVGVTSMTAWLMPLKAIASATSSASAVLADSEYSRLL
ncbi:hypothetical protein D3C75_1103450 [compost metagenome]